jgi:hypothetical protein
MGIGSSSAQKSPKKTDPKKSEEQTNDIDEKQTPENKSEEQSDEDDNKSEEQVENIKKNINNKIKNCQKFLDNVEDEDIKLELQDIIDNLQNLNEQSNLTVLNTHGKHNCDKTYKKAKSLSSEKKGNKSSKKKGSKSSEKSQLTQDQLTQVKNIKTNINSKLKNCNNFINKVKDDEIKEKLIEMKNQLLEILKEEDKSKVLKTSYVEYNCDKIYKKSNNQLSSSEKSDKSTKSTKKNKKSKEKYLKYKMKYLQLKNLLENSKF